MTGFLFLCHYRIDMKNLLKNKIFLAVIVVVIILVGTSFFILRPGSGPANEEGAEEVTDVKQVTTEEIGLTLTPKQNGQVINMQIENVDGMESIQYDLTYDAEVEDSGDTVVIGRGVTGEESVNGPIDIDIDLGTCSRNVCKYDTVVSDVTLILRVNFSNGEIGGLETTVSLEEE